MTGASCVKFPRCLTIPDYIDFYKFVNLEPAPAQAGWFRAWPADLTDEIEKPRCLKTTGRNKINPVGPGKPAEKSVLKASRSV